MSLYNKLVSASAISKSPVYGTSISLLHLTLQIITSSVARESGVTHMTLQQYLRKSELLQTPYVDQFMSQLKFSQMKKTERCPIILYVRQSFTTAFLGKQPGHPKNMSKLILTAYINVANKGANVETGGHSGYVILEN